MMEKTLMFTLPFPPSVNTYYRTYLGRMLISRKGREYCGKVLRSLIEQKMTAGFTTERLRIDILACRGDRRKYDLDNLLKPLIDSLASTNNGACLFDNDEQLDEILIVRGPVDTDGPGLVRIHLADITAEN